MLVDRYDIDIDIGDMLRIGVARGVERGVELADKRPLGLVSCRLNKFSFSSATEIERFKKDNYR